MLLDAEKEEIKELDMTQTLINREDAPLWLWKKKDHQLTGIFKGRKGH